MASLFSTVESVTEIFHKTYERGLLGNVPKNRNKKLNKLDVFRTASPFSRVKINTLQYFL